MVFPTEGSAQVESRTARRLSMSNWSAEDLDRVGSAQVDAMVTEAAAATTMRVNPK